MDTFTEDKIICLSAHCHSSAPSISPGKPLNTTRVAHQFLIAPKAHFGFLSKNINNSDS